MTHKLTILKDCRLSLYCNRQQSTTQLLTSGRRPFWQLIPVSGIGCIEPEVAKLSISKFL